MADHGPLVSSIFLNWAEVPTACTQAIVIIEILEYIDRLKNCQVNPAIKYCHCREVLSDIMCLFYTLTLSDKLYNESLLV